MALPVPAAVRRCAQQLRSAGLSARSPPAAPPSSPRARARSARASIWAPPPRGGGSHGPNPSSSKKAQPGRAAATCPAKPAAAAQLAWSWGPERLCPLRSRPAECPAPTTCAPGPPFSAPLASGGDGKSWHRLRLPSPAERAPSRRGALGPLRPGRLWPRGLLPPAAPQFGPTLGSESRGLLPPGPSRQSSCHAPVPSGAPPVRCGPRRPSLVPGAGPGPPDVRGDGSALCPEKKERRWSRQGREGRGRKSKPPGSAKGRRTARARDSGTGPRQSHSVPYGGAETDQHHIRADRRLRTQPSHGPLVWPQQQCE